MVYVAPSPARASVRETAEGVEVVIPAKRQWDGIVFIPLWLCGWAVGQALAGKTLFDPETPTAGISQATYFNWKMKYEGMTPTELLPQVVRLRAWSSAHKFGNTVDGGFLEIPRQDR